MKENTAGAKKVHISDKGKAQSLNTDRIVNQAFDHTRGRGSPARAGVRKRAGRK